MGLIDIVKGFFRKDKGIADEFDFSSLKRVEDYLDESEGNENKKKQRVDIIAEFENLTNTISNLQMLEQIPKAEKKEIITSLKQLQSAKLDRKQFQEKSSQYTDRQYKYIMQHEDVIIEDLKKMKNFEDQQVILKTDINYLEGERGEQEYSKQQVLNRSKMLKSFSIFAFLSIGILLLILTAIVSGGGDIGIPSIFVMFYSFISLTIIFITRRNIDVRLQSIAFKHNKAIQLQDKVKIKYVNITSFLEYLYGKYHVMSYNDLLYQYNQYTNYRMEMKNYRNTSQMILSLEEALEKQVRTYGIEHNVLLKQNIDAFVTEDGVDTLIEEYMERRNMLKQQIEAF